MQAALLTQYGGPEVLEIAEAPEPHPGPGQVRIVVHAASINPIDWKIRSGAMAPAGAPPEPVIPGFDAAGVVDEIGEGVTGVSLGAPVLGLGSATNAEFAVLRSFVAKPTSLDWPEAAALGVGAETAVRVFTLLGLTAGQTVLIDGAAGGVGSAAVQIAVARGATVLGTGSERNDSYLTQLGATPIRYGVGLADRARHAAPEGIDAVFDVVGKAPIEELVSLVADPQQVVSIANFGAAEAGARVTSGGETDPVAALQEAVELSVQGKLNIDVRTFPLADIAEAHELSEQGHVRGKLVLVI